VDKGWDRSRGREYVMLGLNYRMTELQGRGGTSAAEESEVEQLERWLGEMRRKGLLPSLAGYRQLRAYARALCSLGRLLELKI